MYAGVSTPILSLEGAASTARGKISRLKRAKSNIHGDATGCCHHREGVRIGKQMEKNK